jgi:hypothetical protein
MANRNQQKAMFDYLQSLYYQTQVNRGPNSSSAGRIPGQRGTGVPAGWMEMMGGVPHVQYGGPQAPTRSDALLAGAANRPDNNYARAQFNEMKRQEAQVARGSMYGFDPMQYMPQYSGPQVAPGGSGYGMFNGRLLKVNGGGGKQEKSLVEQLAQSYLDQQNEAKKQNELRYDEGKKLAVKNYEDNLSWIDTLGSQQRADLREDYDKQGKADYADLVGRGLAGSTVTSAVAGNNLKEQSKSLNRLEDFLTRQKVDASTSGLRNIQDFIERREDVTPDLNQLIQLSQGLGQGNNGMGFGYNPQTQGMYSTGGGMQSYGQPNQLLGGTPSTGTGMGNDMRTMPAQQPNWQQSQYANYQQQQRLGGGGMAGGGGGYANPPSQWGYNGRVGFPQGGFTPNPNQRHTPYGGRLNANQLGARPTVDYAAAAQYENSLKAPVQQQQQQRFTPNFNTGGGYRPLQAMPAPQFAPAGAAFALPNMSYGQMGGFPMYGYSAPGNAARKPATPTAKKPVATGSQKRPVASGVINAFNPIGTETVSRGANQLGNWMGQGSNWLGGMMY